MKPIRTLHDDTLALMVKNLYEDFGNQQIPIIKAIRALTGWDLKQAKQFSDNHRPKAFRFKQA